jgi:GrpB-like predicted nucleotidyltransferase (UPF0157 family)
MCPSACSVMRRRVAGSSVLCHSRRSAARAPYASNMAPVRIRPEEQIRDAVVAAFEAHATRFRARLPVAEIEHVGSTSIPGALTKGDLDLLVRVEATEFDAAVRTARDVYDVHQPENWTRTYASFVDPEATDPPVGVQVVVRGSGDDRPFGPFRGAMIADPGLLAAYNRFKLEHDGEGYERYTEAKGVFVEQVLRGVTAA